MSDRSYLIIGTANVAHWSVRLQLLAGKFDYQDYGILDRDHLHFFTLDTFQKMLEHSGFQVLDLGIDPGGGLPVVNGIIRRLPLYGKKLENRLFSKFPNFFAYQMVARCKKQ